METVFPNCTDRVGKIIYDGPIHLLNTTIVPPGADGTWTVETVDTSFVNHCISTLAHAGQVGFIASHIGHEATAAVASELLRQKIDMDRTPWNGDGLAFALQLNGRPAEGKILNREEMETLGYSWRVLFRDAPAAPTAPPIDPRIAAFARALEAALPLLFEGDQGRHEPRRKILVDALADLT